MTCDFHGDSIQLYAKLAKISIKDTAYKLLRGNMFTRQVDTESIDVYLRKAKERQAVQEFWKDSRRRLSYKSPSSEHLSLLQRFHMALDYNPKWSGGLGRFVGGSTKERVADLFPQMDTPARNYLVLPYQDVPGRICSLLLLAGRRSIFYKVNDWNESTEEGGLYMLETTTPNLPAIYALGDPMLALYMQRKRLLDSNKPLPIVAWNDDTNLAWGSIQAKRLIFWDRKISYRVIEQARRMDGYITTYPSLGSQTVYEFVRDHFGVNSIISGMDEHAKYWIDALVDYMLRSQPIDVADTLSQLALTANERQEVITRCPDKSIDRIQNYLDAAAVASSIKFDQRIITERNGTWVLRAGQNSPEELLSDAIIRIHKVMRHESEGKNYFSGVIEFEGRSVPFMNTLERVVNNTYDWLVSTVVKAGLGMPNVNKKWKHKLINIAQSFEKPKIIPMAEKVGWDGECFNFPMFAIMNGSFTNKPDVAYPESTPAADIHLPRRLDPEDIETVVKNIAGIAEFWALFSCLCANTMAVPFGLFTKDVRRSIGLLGSAADLTRHAVESAYSLTRIELSNMHWRRYLKQAGQHDFPLILHHKVSSGLWKRIVSWKQEADSNFITPLPIPAAFSISITDDWLFVAGGDEIEDLPSKDFIQKILPMYIARLQANNFELPSENNIWYSILDDLCIWIGDMYPEYGNPSEVFERAKTLVRIGNPDSESNHGARLIHFLIYLSRHQELGISFAGYQSSEDDVVIDTDSNLVRIDIRRISKVADRLGAPAWDWSAIEAKFRGSNSLVSVENSLGQPAALIIRKGEFDKRHTDFVDQSMLSKLLTE